MRLCFDSNILIDAYRGIQLGVDELATTEERVISVVTWVEVLAGCRDEMEDRLTRTFLSGFDVVPLSSDVAEAAVELRRTRRLKLPDAVVLATARVSGCQLSTRNTKDFSESDPDIRVPYRL